MTDQNESRTTLNIQQPSNSQLPLAKCFQQNQKQLQSLINTPTSSCSTIQGIIERQDKQQNIRQKGLQWSETEQLYYFVSILSYVIENPYLTVSWTYWKPIKYFRFIANKMFQFYGSKAPNAQQLKTKDQHLKKLFYNTKNKKMDIVDLAQAKIALFVKRMSEQSYNKVQNTQKMRLLYNSCSETLKCYKELISELKKKKEYEIQLSELVKFINSNNISPKLAQKQKLELKIARPNLIQIDQQ